MTFMAEPEQPEHRVLIVEDRAHRPLGHFPNRFAELAEGFAALGCTVEVLTSHGWLRDGERPVPFVVRRLGWFRRVLWDLGAAFENTSRLRRVARAARTHAQVRGARSRCRRAGLPRPDVIVVSWNHDPTIASIAAGQGRWLFYQFGEPPGTVPTATRRAARAEQRRRADGVVARIAVPDDGFREQWCSVAPALDPVTLRIAGSVERALVPDAQRRLGLDADASVALLFGTDHGDKDVDVVARVFAKLTDWQLVVVGDVARDYRQHRGPGRDPIVIGGYVDEATRALVYSAADLVVASFRPGFHRDSGIVMDALSWGVPVVCSDGSPAAAAIREYRLGLVFEPGDPDSLERAVRQVQRRVDPADLARARQELSNRAVAARMLEALSEPRSTEPRELP
jgi:glycosyltransferase involved in cell wall biosynthesis